MAQRHSFGFAAALLLLASLGATGALAQRPPLSDLIRANSQVTGTSSVTVTNTTAPGQTIDSSASLVLTATVQPDSGSTPPTGTVEFYDQSTGTNLGVDTLTAATGTSSTVQQTVTGVLAEGTHAILAEYSGDSTYAPANSAAVSVTVRGATATTVAASPASLTPNTPEALTATVLPSISPFGSSAAITGTVSFYDGTNYLGQATVTTNSSTLSNVTLADGVAHSITAVYSGDANWLTSTSAVLTLGAPLSAVTVTLAANSTTGQPGGSIVLTATVTPNNLPTAGSEQNPTGTVVFYQGTTIVGSASLAASLADSSTASLTVQTLPGGQNQLTANYTGDTDFGPAASTPITVNVQAFTIAPAATNPATSLTLAQGASGSESFLITGQGGFNSLIQVVCTPPAADNITCTSSPQQVTPPGTVTFDVQTSTTPLAGNHPAGPDPDWPRATGGAALAGLVFLLLPFGRRARSRLDTNSRQALVLILLLVGLGGAGIGCSGGNALAPYGTPLGIATVKVTATAYVNNAVTSQTLYFTVDVVPQ